MMRSPCCDAEVWPHVDHFCPGRTNWYACTACGQPCDPVEASEKDATLSHPDGCSEGEK